MSARRSPEDLLKSLAAYADDDPGARPIAELSPAERDAELRAFGVDPDAVRARGAAHADGILARLADQAAPHVAEAHEAPPPPAAATALPGWLWAVAGVVLAAVLAWLILGRGDGQPPPPPGPRRDRPDAARAPTPVERLVADAREACARKAWAACLGALDEAHALDPSADDSALARGLRDAANRAITAEERADAGRRDAGFERKGRGSR